MKKSTNPRRKYNPNEKAILLAEVKSLCPLCSEKLVSKKDGKTIINYEIAHIYPHSPTKYQLELLKNEIKLSDDVDEIENLIMLCPTCHTRYDKYTTVQEYRNLCEIKQHMLIETKCRDMYSKYTIDDEINALIESLAEAFNNLPPSDVELEFKALRVSDKSNDTLDPITRIMIESNIRMFFLSIQQKFNELENDSEGIFEMIATQVKSFYLQLKRTEKNQTIIFEQIVEWIYEKTGRKNRTVCFILASFFVQNCEVLS